MIRFVLFGLFCVMFAVQTLHAEVPPNIHYQGVLKNADDSLVQGSKTLLFRLFDTEVGGSALWFESQTLTVTDGAFSAVLGAEKDLTVVFDRPYWLSVEVDGQELTPRVALIPVPYSLNTRSIPDGVVTADKIADGQVVRSINGLTDGLTLEAGDNVTVTTEDNRVVISAAGGGGTEDDSAGVQSVTVGQSALTGTISLVAGSENVTVETGENNQVVISVSGIDNAGNTITGDQATVAGGMGNQALADFAAIGGGGVIDGNDTTGNRVTDNYGTVGGGGNNQAGDGDDALDDMTYATVSGGRNNTASGAYATVPGGRGNLAAGINSFAAGQRAKAVNQGTFVWADHAAEDFESTSEGQFLIRAQNGVGINTNTPNPDAGLTVEGDIIIRNGTVKSLGNNVSADFGTIGGGGRTISGDGNTGNRVTDIFGTIGGGGNNRAGSNDGETANDPFATVGGGEGNRATGSYATVPGGANNRARGSYSFAAGRNAYADNAGSFVWASGSNNEFHSNANNQFLIRANGGVGINTNETPHALNVNGTIAATVVLQGSNNNPSGSRSTVGGGRDNSTFDNLSTVGGGRDNVAGTDDSINDNSQAATVSGGRSNQALASFATVSGGENNTVDGSHSVIAGGSNNEILANLAFIGGGGGPNGNRVSDRWGSVMGGRNNRAGGADQDITNSMYASVGGGQSNIASGEAATVPGGSGNRAGGDYSFAAGRNAKATHAGTFVWADNRNVDFASSNSRQFLIQAQNGVGVGTNDPQAQMAIMGPNSNPLLALQYDARQGSVDRSSQFVAFYATDQNTGERQYQGGIRGLNAQNVGIQFHSATGDFAEYLKRLDKDEDLNAGDIVGVFGGKVTRKTEGAHHLMVVTDRAIVSGNAPPEGEKHLWEEVAFIGQVPVKVAGRVREGDYLLASGKGNGVGVAVAPENMRAEDYARIVGRAWASSNEAGVKRVNAVVGLAMNQMAQMNVQRAEIRSLRKENAALVNRLVALESMVQKIANETSKNTRTASTDQRSGD